MSQRIDSSIFSAFREGDQTAFNLVFEYYYRPVYYFTRKLIDNKEEAEEIALNSFLKLFQRCQLIDSPGSLKSFLFVTTRNNCFDHLRTSKTLRGKQKEFASRMESEEFFQLEYEIKDELVEMVRKAIDDLPVECGKIFKMLYYEELTPAQIAEILQISVSTVYNQKSRALQALRIAIVNHPLAITFMLLTTVLFQTDHFTHYNVLME